MRKVYMILAATLFMGLLSCSTAGNNFNADLIKKEISLGLSTKEDVVRTCGEPLSKNNEAAEGLEVWHYAYVDKKMTGTGIITHTVGVGDEWKSTTTVMDIYFRNDIVVDYRLENSQLKRMNYR
jgi:hypothetical protein